jgi:hypothetical protein
MPPETPTNGGYMVAAYIVTALITLGYAFRLWRKARSELRD